MSTAKDYNIWHFMLTKTFFIALASPPTTQASNPSPVTATQPPHSPVKSDPPGSISDKSNTTNDQGIPNTTATNSTDIVGGPNQSSPQLTGAEGGLNDSGSTSTGPQNSSGISPATTGPLLTILPQSSATTSSDSSSTALPTTTDTTPLSFIKDAALRAKIHSILKTFQGNLNRQKFKQAHVAVHSFIDCRVKTMHKRTPTTEPPRFTLIQSESSHNAWLKEIQKYCKPHQYELLSFQYRLANPFLSFESSGEVIAAIAG